MGNKESAVTNQRQSISVRELYKPLDTSLVYYSGFKAEKATPGLPTKLEDTPYMELATKIGKGQCPYIKKKDIGDELTTAPSYVGNPHSAPLDGKIPTQPGTLVDVADNLHEMGRRNTAETGKAAFYDPNSPDPLIKDAAKAIKTYDQARLQFDKDMSKVIGNHQKELMGMLLNFNETKASPVNAELETILREKFQDGKKLRLAVAALQRAGDEQSQSFLVGFRQKSGELKKTYDAELAKEDGIFKENHLNKVMAALDRLTYVPVRYTRENGETVLVNIPNTGTLREGFPESTPARVMFFLERTAKGLTSERFPPCITNPSTESIGLCVDIANVSIKIRENYILPALREKGMKDEEELEFLTGLKIPMSKFNRKRFTDAEPVMEKVCQFAIEQNQPAFQHMADAYNGLYKHFGIELLKKPLADNTRYEHLTDTVDIKAKASVEGMYQIFVDNKNFQAPDVSRIPGVKEEANKKLQEYVVKTNNALEAIDSLISRKGGFNLSELKELRNKLFSAIAVEDDLARKCLNTLTGQNNPDLTGVEVKLKQEVKFLEAMEVSVVRLEKELVSFSHELEKDGKKPGQNNIFHVSERPETKPARTIENIFKDMKLDIKVSSGSESDGVVPRATSVNKTAKIEKQSSHLFP